MAAARCPRSRSLSRLSVSSEQGELGGLSSEFQAESNLSGVNVNARPGGEAKAAIGECLCLYRCFFSLLFLFAH